MTRHHQHFGKGGFAIIFIHYNGSRAFVDISSVNAYDHLAPSPSSKGYVSSFDTKVYHTFIRGSSATWV